MKKEIQVRISATRRALEEKLEELCTELEKRPRQLTAEASLSELELQLGDGTRLVRELLTLHRVARGQT
jgi:hypothetical protein